MAARAKFGPRSLVAMVLGVTIATAIPGSYYTNNDMTHKRLPNPLPNGIKTPVQTREECETICSDHPICDAYAYSNFHKTCQINQAKTGERAIIQNMYQLYVREKSADDGYIKFGTDYLKMYLQLKNYKEASLACAAEGGGLVSITTEDLSDALLEEISLRKVSACFIGLSDEKEEGNWIHADGTPLNTVDFTNWDWNAVWNRTDYNCAIIGLDGTWSHTNCGYKYYYICQIPMF